MSYTTFEYNNINVEVKGDKIIATVDVKNTGKGAGDEVVQLYIGFEESQIERPKKLLKGFTRISLEPNQTKNATIEIPIKRLAWYNPQSKSWEIEQINYTAYLGKSSKTEDLLSTQFTLD